LWGISTDATYSRVIHFDHTDGSEFSPGIPSGSAGLSAPGGIAVGPDGNIYVSSRGTGQILFYDGQTGDPLTLTGGQTGVFANVGALPGQLKFGPDGNLYMSELFGTSVRVYETSTGNRLADAATELESANGLAFGPAGDLYVGDGFEMGGGTGARVYRVHEGTKELFGATGAGGLFAPGSLLFLPDGDLLVVDLLANYIARFDENGMNQSVFAVVPPLIAPPATHFPADLVYDPDGNLILGVLGENNPPDPNLGQLLRYDLQGNLIQTIKDGLEQLGGLAWTPSAATAAGDYDNDGNIDTADYDKWKTDFGKTVATANGADGNGDGIVDAADYTIWRDNFAPAAELAAAVPEPASALLLGLGAFFLFSACSHHRSGRCVNIRSATGVASAV
jgi:sugar lactone lactonase YvrE